VGNKLRRPNDDSDPQHACGGTAHSAGGTLTSYRIAAPPVLEGVLGRLRLEAFLRDHLPRDDRRSRVSTATGLMILLKNLLISRQPLYGIGEWAARHAPQWSGLIPIQLPSLNDDRVGRCLDRLFDADIPSLTLAVVAHAVRESSVDLDELHNDSTTVTSHGDSEAADHQRTLRGKLRLAVTHGHNKDPRPDLEQLLYILTVSRDGAVPVHFRVDDGNATDDRSHLQTRKTLCELTGRRDFLSVADCELATAENLAHIHRHGGRSLTILPRTRGEDTTLRAAVRAGPDRGKPIHDRLDDQGQWIDRYRIDESEATTTEGYRSVWYHGVREAELDALTRHKRLERATAALTELQAKLASTRTRYRDQAQVAQAVDTILSDGDVEGWLVVEIRRRTTETSRQDRRGRPGPETRYVRNEATRFDLSWRIDHDRLAGEARCDGIFPLVTNETSVSAVDRLLAYKQQPMIAKRFSRLKTDFVVAPVFLKEVSRIQSLLCVSFVAPLTESLSERELRGAMAREGLESLPLYPEGRACCRPTARRVIDLFEDVQRHELTTEGRTAVLFMTDLTGLQRKILRLLGMPKAYSS
jgi:transposase